MRHTFLLVAALGWFAASASSARAQAVQLPTFRYFTVDTTVSVPDRGGAVLGGVSRASSGTTSRGFAWRGGGRESTRASVRKSPTSPIRGTSARRR